MDLVPKGRVKIGGGIGAHVSEGASVGKGATKTAHLQVTDARSEPLPSGKADLKRNLRQKAAEDWPHSKTWRESCVQLLATRLGVRPVLCRFHNLLPRSHFENEFLRRRAFRNPSVFRHVTVYLVGPGADAAFDALELFEALFA